MEGILAAIMVAFIIFYFMVDSYLGCIATTIKRIADALEGKPPAANDTKEEV